MLVYNSDSAFWTRNKTRCYTLLLEGNDLLNNSVCWSTVQPLYWIQKPWDQRLFFLWTGQWFCFNCKKKKKKKGRALLRVEKTLPCSCNSNKSKRVSPCFSELKIENNSVLWLITSHCTNPAFCMVLRGFPVIYKQVSCSYFLEEMWWSC